MNTRHLACTLALAALLPLSACDRADTPPPSNPTGTSNTTPAPAATPPAPPAGSASAGPDAFPALIVDSIDGAPVAIAEAKASAKEGDKIILTGHIGGREDPFVAGRAAFTLVDPKLHPCTDGCKTPWDFCCDSQEDIAANAATIQVVDADGRVIRTPINGHKGIKPGAEIVVAGTVTKRDTPAVLIVNADKIWVKGG